jgi:hypothetical protein
MPHIVFAPSIQRHVEVAEQDLPGATLAGLLQAVFLQQPKLRGYLLDDQGGCAGTSPCSSTACACATANAWAIP